MCPINGSSIDHMMMLPDGCWCLSDGNARVMYPCEAFDRQGLSSFLITPPRPERYKKWRSQAVADTVITALPRTVEVAAIAYVNYQLTPCSLSYDLVRCSFMNHQDPRRAVSLVQEWGPCTRTVLTILNFPNEAKKSRTLRVRRNHRYTQRSINDTRHRTTTEWSRIYAIIHIPHPSERPRLWRLDARHPDHASVRDSQ